MIRVSKRTRDVIGVIAREDYGGVTLDEALERLVREHWQQRAIGAMDQYRDENPAAWRDYLAEADSIGALDHEITE
jgi:hypothetical protein